MDSQIVIDGAELTVRWAVDSRGQAPARDFFLAQSQEDRAKLLALFRRLADVGAIINREKFKKLDDDLWEFKSFQLRMLGAFRPNGIFLIAHGVRKKRDHLAASDLATARRILSEHDRRNPPRRTR